MTVVWVFSALKIAYCFHLGTLKVCEDTTLSDVFNVLISTSPLRLNGNVSFACINRQLDANTFSISTSPAVNCQCCDYTFFTLTFYVTIWTNKWDLPRLSQFSIQAWGWFVSVVYSCWIFNDNEMWVYACFWGASSQCYSNWEQQSLTLV